MSPEATLAVTADPLTILFVLDGVLSSSDHEVVECALTRIGALTDVFPQATRG